VREKEGMVEWEKLRSFSEIEKSGLTWISSLCLDPTHEIKMSLTYNYI